MTAKWRILAGTGILAVLAAGIVVLNPFGAEKAKSAPAAGGTELATVREGALSTQVTQSGTLSYAGQFTVVNQAKGIYTWIPGAGKQIDCGKALYRVDERPIVLICGDTPAYRSLSVGDKGREVRDLNANLVRLGYADASRRRSDYYSAETAYAVAELQDDLGVPETGRLDLGDAVFLPGPLRVTKSLAEPGTPAAPGGRAATATTARRQVLVELDAGQQAQVKVGDRAEITLPDNRTTTGRVSRIGTVARTDADKNPTIPAYITLDRPKDAGTLDAAPVRVQITTDGVAKALIVPVTALLGRPEGGYAVEVAANGRNRLVTVTLGMFDNDNGLVQVSGALSVGDRVVVPAS
ncbi:peptidoglycan-binding protein [Actinomadura rayongensis]|uniref:Peptidoglycan binding-like domain-containing protein n=1 Tax=Actinomadura rayongensis TaxID=1429076 RepID=A0A6I4WB20_9ACTN|nr:efflux RND transporter periplasmic adaptor subunit [Actinomadura rayongensis]MXQ65226.1 hypothetical protein [Actinomadura rayongensis]